MKLASLRNLLASLSLFACSSLFAAPLTVDVSGAQSAGWIGDIDNTVLGFDVGAHSIVTSVSYTVNITAYSPSWLADMSLMFTDSDLLNGVILTPAPNDWFSGAGTYSDTADLVDLGLSFAVGADGILHLEFLDTFDDLFGVDGEWNFGTITFGIETVDVEQPGEVPEPATGLLLGAGLAVLGYTQRRRKAAAH